QGVRLSRARAATRAGDRINLRGRTGRLLADATGLAVFAVMAFPLYWMIATAFKPGRDILSLTPKWVPDPFTLQNFQDAIARPFFFDDVKNSLIVVGGTVIISLAL